MTWFRIPGWSFGAQDDGLGSVDLMFRRRMAWLHLWAGLVLGSLLTLIFFMGTLSVYDREIDRWMMPETRLALPAHPLPLDQLRRRLGGIIDTKATWYMLLPDARTPVVEVHGSKSGRAAMARIDPATGMALPDAHTLGATGFFFPLHYSLMIQAKGIGIFIVAFAGITMLALLVSGIVIHRGLFKKFFTLRPGPPLRRFSLDLHALTGLAALPFHVAITLTGLTIYVTTTMPLPIATLYTSETTFDAAAYGVMTRPAARVAAPQASLEDMVRRAKAMWGQGDPFYVHLFEPGDRNMLVAIRRLPSDHLGDEGETVYFDGVTGASLKRATPVAAVQFASVLAGMHLLQVEQPAIRFFYFLGGLAGTTMIATGFVIFAEKRRDRGGDPIVIDAIAVASTLGLVLATAAYMLANRVMPSWPGKATSEVLVFVFTWAGALVHGILARSRGTRRVWQAQARAVAMTCVCAVLMNWISTDMIAVTALVDLALLTTAGFGWWLAVRMRAR